MDETARRRELQTKYNVDHGITPQTIQKAIRSSMQTEVRARKAAQDAIRAGEQELDQTELVRLLEEEMLDAARNLEFERAAQLRDKINEISGAPTIKSGAGLLPDNADAPRTWQPKSKGRPGKRHVAR